VVDTSNPTIVLSLIVGGVLVLLYGVRLITDAMQRDAGVRLRRALMLLTRHRLAAFGVGVLITALTQSSGATSSLLVGLVSAQLIPLTVAIITLLGTNVGSALVVQLLVFNITDYAFFFVGIGAAAAFFTRGTMRRGIGQAAFGIGLIILGLAALKAGSTPLADSHVTATVFEALVRAPIVLALIGAGLTMAFASSVAGVGLVIVLAASGALPIVAALALLFGCNVGTTITALLTALSSGSLAGRRLAFIHCGTRLLGALIALALLNPLTALLAMLHLAPATLVALTHLGFNLTLAIVFVPLAAPLASLATRLLPERTSEEGREPYYLDPDVLSMPAVALGQATREVLHMTDLVTEMLQLSIHAFEDRGSKVPTRIDKLEDQLDRLNGAIKRYLTQLDDSPMSEEQRRRKTALLYVITDLEAIGDIIDKQCMRLARRKQRNQLVFSDEGWHDLLTYHHEVTTALQQALAALAAQDPTLAEEFFARKRQLNQMKREFHLRHLRRLQSGVPVSIESSAIHLDLLTAMSRVLSHASSIAHVIRGDW
jgi:phosphate:Na+ symporter